MVRVNGVRIMRSRVEIGEVICPVGDKRVGIVLSEEYGEHCIDVLWDDGDVSTLYLESFLSYGKVFEDFELKRKRSMNL